MYDIIGDIHGHYRELCALLGKMGYTYDAAAHSFSHPSRTAFFVGDLIDSGNENLKVVELVRNMVRAGSAKAVMGNHEFNAIQYATPDARRPDGYMRSHNERNTHQHSKFLREVAHDPAYYRDIIDWFKTLPVCHVEGRLHIIHACWYGTAIEMLKANGSLSSSGHITAQGWLNSADKATDDFHLFEMILKGPEEKLPDDLSFVDGYGHTRRKSRIKWWVEYPRTFGEAYNIPPYAPFVDASYHAEGPHAVSVLLREGLHNVGHLFFGHYWMREAVPTVLSDSAACVDYSVARHNGHLAAYRYEPDEPSLKTSNFVFVAKVG